MTYKIQEKKREPVKIRVQERLDDTEHMLKIQLIKKIQVARVINGTHVMNTGDLIDIWNTCDEYRWLN